MNAANEFVIRPATAVEIRPLRHRVLRAGLPPDAAVFDGDGDATTFHVAAEVTGSNIVGCATLVRSAYGERSAWRLRGLAVDSAWQRRGVGKRLLDACDSHAIHTGVPLIWCNARTPAVQFYKSLGWIIEGTEFEIPTAGPHLLMSKLIQIP